MANSDVSDLGELEREVMLLLWRHGPMTAETVRERLERPLKDSTVRTVLRRLEEKGHLTHVVDGRTFVFEAAKPRKYAAAKAVQRIVDWFCNGSVDEILIGMVDSKMLDRKKLEKLIAKIDATKAEKK